MGFAPQPVADSECELKDGRRLAYAVWGDPGGRPVFFFHGAPGSRLFVSDPLTTARAGVRLVTTDRPGYGASDPQADRAILDWPEDVAQLADLLDAPRFAIVAHSSGGPYALACAVTMPDRVSRVALVSCVPSLGPEFPDTDDDDPAFTALCRTSPDRAAAQIAEGAAWLTETPQRFVDLPRPEPDRLLLEDPAIRSMFTQSITDAVRQGVSAYAWECVAERRPWGFSADQVRSHVTVWQGLQDAAVPPSAGRALAAALPHSELREVPGAGHGLVLTAWADILEDLNR